MAALTVIGSGWFALLIVPLFFAPRTRPFAASISAALIANAIVVFVLKAIVQRKRPYLVIPNVQALVFEAPTNFSFPSGHAAGSFCTATFIAVVMIGHVYAGSKSWRRRVALTVVAYIMAFGICLSRCALGVHYPGDLLAGALIGAGIGYGVARWHQRRISTT